MRQTPPESLVMAKNMCNFGWNVTMCDMKTKLKQLKEIHLLNLYGENNPKGVQKHPKMTTC
jgi:hypothetical protein